LQPRKQSPQLLQLLKTIAPSQLRAWVERVSQPRHFLGEPGQNRATAQWLCETLQAMGWRLERQGPCANVVALSQASADERVLVGAHYDSVPMCPGADDNGSAVAAMLACAAACYAWSPALPVGFVAFNREEEHLLGSSDFVASYLPQAPFRVRCIHVLEMVGYASRAAGSQRVPTGLPIQLSDTGDFLGLLADAASGDQLDLAACQARTHVPDLAAIGLEVEQGFERVFPVLARSDHVPFWVAGIPALMWTDTAEFRNPHYHRSTDTPDTLNYEFLRDVTQTLTATVIAVADQLARHQ
jgi:Zn-dependent M28 family amino/carboxypeptidase